MYVLLYVCVYAELEITVGHWTFSEQKCLMSRHFWFCSDRMSGQLFFVFVDFKVFNCFSFLNV